MTMIVKERGTFVADKHICIAIYMTHAQADEAFSRLEVEGFDMNLLSFAGRDCWKDMVGSRHTKGRFIYCGKSGAFWERLWANLPAWGVFCFFENGPLLVAGSLVQTIVAAQEIDDEDGSRVDMASGFEAGLVGIGIPEASIIQYEAALLKNQILLFVFGTLHDVNLAQSVLNETKAVNHTLHHGA